MRRLTLVALAVGLLVAGCGGGSSTTVITTTASSTPSGSSTPSTSASGASAVREKLVDTARTTLSGSGFPSDYTACVIGKLRALSDEEVAQLAARGYAAGRATGRRFGRECVAEGKGVAYFRHKFEQGIRAASGSLSKAFVDCVIRRSRREIPDERLVTLATRAAGGGSGSGSGFRAIGRRLGQECVRDGVKP